MKTMNRRDFLKASAVFGVSVSAVQSLSGVAFGAGETVPLAKPEAPTGNVVLDLLKKRMSTREFSPEPLPVHVLSRLLWAAFGINRPDGKRTAPTARNRQDIDVYAATPDGLYLYDAGANVMKLISGEDIRALTGTQPYVKTAAVNLVYVADTTKTAEMKPEERFLWIGAESGAIFENVYLFCTAEGLVTVVRAMIDRPALAKAMKLNSAQVITFSQSVGYPRKAR